MRKKILWSNDPKFNLHPYSVGSKLVLLSCIVIGGAGSLGHSRSGGLRPTEASLLSRHRCHPHVFLHWQPWQFRWGFLVVIDAFEKTFSFASAPCLTRSPCAWCREYSREVDAWGQTLLSQRAHYSCGEQEGPAKWWAHTSRVSKDETGQWAEWCTHNVLC